jgi:D-alanyl-D-alanine carboxypeptidase/D-alanyl-D-alanine-endopeptidase (penicillin-binding protein 4)
MPGTPASAPPDGLPAPRGRRTGLVAVLAAMVVVVLAAAGLVITRPGPVDRWLTRPSATTALPTARPTEPTPGPVLVGLSADAPTPTPAGLKAAIDGLVGAAALGGRVDVSVRDMVTGDALYDHGGAVGTIPASTTKLTTAAAVLAARGQAYTITTRVVAGANPGEVVIVGGGDPTLSAGKNAFYPGAARLDLLAARVRKALGGTRPTTVIVDGTLYGGPVYEPGWDSDIPTSGFAAPATALMIDGGRLSPKGTPGYAERSSTPDLAAGRAFAKALGLPATAVATGKAPEAAAATASPTPPAPGTTLGSVESPPMIRLVEFMLRDSDNVLAEALDRQVALARNQPASFAGAAKSVTALLGELGLDTTGLVLADGSGLSRTNRIPPALLTALLAKAARTDRPALSGIFAGLPVAAWSGTLGDRFQGTGAKNAAGSVRAKTGTLTGVHAMAGLVTTAEGRALSFAILSDRVSGPGEAAQQGIDRIAATLAACGCR